MRKLGADPDKNEGPMPSLTLYFIIQPPSYLYMACHLAASIRTHLPADVELICCTRGWLRYRLPKRMIRHHSKPLCIGQKQRWFLLRLRAQDSAVCFHHSHKPEFDGWRWVSYWYPLGQVISFKREVYRGALKELVERHGRLTRHSPAVAAPKSQEQTARHPLLQVVR
jgi:hypothetical protein